MIRCLVAAACGLVLTGPALAQRAVPAAPAPDNAASPSSEGTPLVFLGDKRPVLLRLRVEIDGRPVQEAWRDYLKKWFDFLDRDGDGRLNAQELRHAPREQAFLQMMRSPVAFTLPGAGGVFLMSHLGKKEDDTIGLDDFVGYYDSKRVAPVQLNAGPSGPVTFSPGGRVVAGGNSTAGLGDILFRALDLDKDGRLSREELLQAPQILRKLDSDDDELITAQDMTPNTNPAFARPVLLPKSGAGGAPANRQGAFFLPSSNTDATFAVLLLAQYDGDKNRKLNRAESGLAKEDFQRLDTNADGELDAEELARWHQRPGDLTFTVRLGKTKGPAVEIDKRSNRSLMEGVKPAPDGQFFSLGDAEIRIAREAGPPLRLAIQNQLTLIFRQADKDSRGFVEMKDLQAGRQFAVLAQAFPMLDRDGDGKLTLKEVQTFIDLQARAASSHASIAIAEHGRNLFQLLDANGDNRLSPREQQTAWARLKARDLDGDGVIDASELARQFQVTVEQGGNLGLRNFRGGGLAPEPPRPAYPRNAPAWFKKMDKNGDGDVSLREFLGTRDEFTRIDTDRDGLISADEAERFRPKED